MNQVLKYSAITFFTILISTIVSCKDDDDNIIKPPVTSDIIELATIDPDLSFFLEALEKTALTATLKETGPFTVLAPNNNAFETFFADLGVIDLNEIPVDTLKNILLNHVISGEKLSTSNLTSGQGSGYKTTLAKGVAAPDVNLSLFFDTTNGVIFNGLSSVISGKEDIQATNGFLHQVQSIINLPTVLEFITADSNFDTLEAALIRTDQEPILEALNDKTNKPLTIFAPTNLAFTNLFINELKNPETEEAGTLQSIDSLQLNNTLLLHTMTISNTRAEQLTDGTITTLGGDLTSSAANATLKDSNAREATITSTNLQASDGVIHAIDKVLLPVQ